MEKLDVIERFKNYGDDVDKNDLICFAISNGFFDDIFVYLNNDEKRNYAFCLSSSRLVAYLSDLSYDEAFLIIFDSIMKPNFNFSVLIDLCYFLDDCYKFEIIKLFRYIIPFYYYDKKIQVMLGSKDAIRIVPYFVLPQFYPIFAYREADAPLLCSYRGGSLSHKTTPVQAHRGFRLLTLAS